MRKKTSGLTNEIRIRRCYGCGAILQSDNQKGTGYLPKEKLAAESEQLCERCYRLRHYNVDDSTPHFNEDFASILAQAQKTDALVVYVLDIFSLEASIVPEIEKHLPAKLLVILNKRDILPKSMSDDKLLQNAEQRLKSAGIEPLGTLVISSVKNYNIDDLMAKINQLRAGKDVYFVGASQVGKSSIINNLLKNYKNKTDKFITTSIYPGTTLDVIQIPIDNDSYLYDTPGIFNPTSFLNQVERQILKYIIPRTEINPKVYQAAEKQSFLLGAVARFDFLAGPKSNFTFVISNDIQVTRTKLDRADNTFNSLAITRQAIPVSATVREIKDLVRHEFTLPASGTVDVMIVGLGYIAVAAAGQRVAVYAPANVAVKLLTMRWY